VTLARDLGSGEAEQLLSRLQQAGVAVTRTRTNDQADRYRIEVASGAVERALLALRANAGSDPRESEADEAPLIPTQAEQRQRAERRLARELARSIELLPNVIQARVHVRLPSAPGSFPVDPTPASAALLILERRSDAEIARKARALLQAALPELAPEAITLLESVSPRPDAGAPAFAQLGPIQVSSESAALLKLWFGLSLLLHMLLATSVLWLLRSRRAKL
jgi:type III secretory pathway lipoprotein EscJ